VGHVESCTGIAASGTPVGPRTAFRTKPMRIRTPMDDGKIVLVHNGIMKTTHRCARNWPQGPHVPHGNRHGGARASIRQFYEGDLTAGGAAGAFGCRGHVWSGDCLRGRAGAHCGGAHGFANDHRPRRRRELRGVGRGGVSALYARRDYMEDGEIADINAEVVQHRTLTDVPVNRKLEQITFDVRPSKKAVIRISCSRNLRAADHRRRFDARQNSF